jgi:hypothetical protein
MAIRSAPVTFPVRSAGDGLTPPTESHVGRPVLSTTLLADTVDLMRQLERRLEGRHCQEPEAALAALERLEVWARARPWEVPPTVVQKADRILRTAEHAYSTISAACWIESLPDEILALLDRRRPGYLIDRAAEEPDVPGVARIGTAPVPRRRASDR